MLLKILYRKILPFVITFTVGIFISGFSEYKLLTEGLPRIEQPQMLPNTYLSNRGNGHSGYSNGGTYQNCFVCKDGRHERESSDTSSSKVEVNDDRPHILSKPIAVYTKAARENNIQGVVRLKVALLASGQIGSITPITRLPFGLTEQAVIAARRIEFKPKAVNGNSVSVIVVMEYNFTIY